MNIREGALVAPPKQDKLVRDFLDSIHNTIQGVFVRNDSVSVPVFKKLLEPFQNKNLSVTRGIRLTTKFGFYNKRDEENPGWIEEIVPTKHYVIIMDMSWFVNKIKTSDEYEPVIINVDWTEFYSVFIHEYKHFIQVLKSGGKVFSDANRNYFEQPDEQQANAEQYLEKLKHQLQTTNYDVILNFLKKKELSNSPSLWHLKKQNPAAWKRVMKQVVLAAIRDANQKQ